MNIAEQIYAIAKSLSEEQASEILNFAESIHAKYLNSDRSLTSSEKVPWAELVYSLAGAWEDFPTLEEIRAEAGEDVLRESF